ncbi:hypothetical protein OH77DRAFT_1490395 [Trametes cingulata]|nr:hypothetical protein OH77DRAFT_1490395 [Trametes cingulata]
MTFMKKEITFQDLLEDRRICASLFSHVSARTLLRLDRLCRLAHSAVGTYMKAAFDVNTLLARFFSDPLGFRVLQAHTGTLVSGSSALQFFDRTFYPASDLDLYVYPRHRREVGRWILDAGYAFSPGRGQDADFEIAVMRNPQSRGLHYVMPGVSGILTFYRMHRERRLKVQIIVARRTPMEVILGFHSTCVMNVISFERAYCIFPLATLERRVSLLAYSSQGRSTRRVEGLDKYTARGFHMLAYLPLADLVLPHKLAPFTFGPRWLGDRDTWVIKLDTTHIPPTPPPNPYSTARTCDPAVLCNFFVRYDLTDGAIMELCVLESPVLRYSYVLADNDAIDFLSRALAAKACDEQFKVVACQLEDSSYVDALLPEMCLGCMRDNLARRSSSLRA